MLQIHDVLKSVKSVRQYGTSPQWNGFLEIKSGAKFFVICSVWNFTITIAVIFIMKSCLGGLIRQPFEPPFFHWFNNARKPFSSIPLSSQVGMKIINSSITLRECKCRKRKRLLCSSRLSRGSCLQLIPSERLSTHTRTWCLKDRESGQFCKFRISAIGL